VRIIKIGAVIAAAVAIAAFLYAEDEAGALERALLKAADKVEKAVVAIEMDRPEEKAAAQPRQGRVQGGRRMPNPAQAAGQNFNKRPDAPVSGVHIGGGYVLTSNYNVEGNVSDIKVAFSDGKRFSAVLKGRDEVRDLALIKIEPETGVEELPAVELAADHKFQTGEFVAVVGRGENIACPCVTTGIISALNRADGNLVQVDAPLNYGNTGGAVVNLEGKLVGIAAGISANTMHGQSSGVGFVAPSEAIIANLKDMKESKTIKRPPQAFLGVQADQTGGTPGVSEEGAVIAQVLPNTSADAAGLKAGDVIIEYNGKAVKAWEDLAGEIKKTAVGSQFTCKVKRKKDDGQWAEQTLSGTMGEKPFGR
jgi:S1-C subfamily serine protease